ncbi:MAG: 4-(cytidine 5'-diphospho)-2-C-methyl-D-erythritol kinase [Candidatus Zixiibacteriota bacterium]
MFIKDETDNSIVIDAPAKINLFLEVMNRREDGYHDINSVFQAVSLYDRLEFTISARPGIKISLTGDIELSTGEDNLIARAYRMISEEFGVDRGLEVVLEKNIPVAAGLGGGSADGAATILACNRLFKLNLSAGSMGRLSERIGSDMPFFFTRGQALVTGRGDIIEEIELPTDYWVVLVNPGWEISTAAAYHALKRGLTRSKNPFNLAACPRAEELVRLLNLSGNDFEKVHLKSYPELGRIQEGLLRSGASLARMTGSGPTFFGIFNSAPEIREGATLRQGSWQLFTVLPVTFASQGN